MVTEARSLEKVLDINVRVKTFLPLLPQAIALAFGGIPETKDLALYVCLFFNFKYKETKHSTPNTHEFTIQFSKSCHFAILASDIFSFFKDILQAMHALHPKGIHSLPL